MTLNELFDRYNYLIKEKDKYLIKRIQIYFKDCLNLDANKLNKKIFRKIIVTNKLGVVASTDIFKFFNKVYHQAYKDSLIETNNLCLLTSNHHKISYDYKETDKVFEILNSENNKSIKILLFAYKCGIRIKDVLNLKKSSLCGNTLHFRNIDYILDDNCLNIVKENDNLKSIYLFSKQNGEKLTPACFRNCELFVKLMTGIDEFKIGRFEESLRYNQKPVKSVLYKELCEQYFERFMLNDCLQMIELNRNYISPYLEHLKSDEIEDEDIRWVFKENQSEAISNYRIKNIYRFLKKLLKYGSDNGYSIYPEVLTNSEEIVYKLFPHQREKQTLKICYQAETFDDLSINLLSPFVTVSEFYFCYVDKENRESVVNQMRKISYPFFKDKKVSEINEIDVINLLDKYRNYYSQWTVYPIKCILRKLFRYIYEAGLNIHDFKDVLYLEKANESPLVIYSREQISRIIEASSFTCYKKLITFCLSSGLRFNEAIVLKWEDVNIKEKIVSVNRTYSDNKHHVVNCRRKRKIYLSDIAYNTLSELKRDDDLVFIDKTREKYIQEIKIYLSSFIEIKSGISCFNLNSLFDNLINSVVDTSNLVSLNSVAGFNRLESLNKRLLKLEDSYIC